MRDILNTHSVASLKKMVSAYNIRGYSKMKKSELIDLMTSPEHKNKFRGIKPRGQVRNKAKMIAELEEKGKKYRKARKEFGKDDPLRKRK